MHDVVIIGAGVVGCAVARELSRFELSIVVLEKEYDVASGASSRNSGVIHSGIHYASGTSRAQLAVQGNGQMRKLCDDLSVKYTYCGKLTVAKNNDEIRILEKLKSQGEKNGVPGLEIIGSDKMKTLQPGVKGIGALYSPTTGIVSPYGLTIALAENAHANRVIFRFGCNACRIHKKNDLFDIQLVNGEWIQGKIVINCAGVSSADVALSAGIGHYKIYPCRGEYHILDKRQGAEVSMLVYPAPHAHSSGLGIHLTKTVDGNIMIGPSNEYIAAEDMSTTADVMRQLRVGGSDLLSGISTSDIIRSFAGVRAKQTPPETGGFADFHISADEISGMINCIGIESPGLTASPAIAEKVASLVGNMLVLSKKKEFISERKRRVKRFTELSKDEKQALVAEDPRYGEVVCRCESITKREIIDAVNNPLGVKTIAGIKYRAGAMMGRCQGGFCLPKILKIMQEDCGMKQEDIFYKGPGSPLIRGNVR